MYLLFVLIQCLLVVLVSGDVNEPRFEGGHFVNGDYVMLEHDTITVTIEAPRVNGYNISWKIIDKQGNPIIFKSDTIILPNNVVQFKMWTEIPKNVEIIQWFWIDSSSNLIGKINFKTIMVKEIFFPRKISESTDIWPIILVILFGLICVCMAIYFIVKNKLAAPADAPPTADAAAADATAILDYLWISMRMYGHLLHR